MRLLLLFLLGSVSLIAAPKRAASFSEALKQAKTDNTPVAVMTYGSTWHLASKRFHDQLWMSEDFSKQLKTTVILTEVDVPQQLDKEQSKAFNEAHKGWEEKAIKSYPAIQLYSPDGFLLKTFQGQEVRILTSASALAAHVDSIVNSSNKRDQLHNEINQARAAKDTEKEARVLAELASLNINHDPKLVEQMQKADPQDKEGWQARLSFKGWDFVRHISELIEKKETDKAMREVDDMLKSDAYKPEQRALILGAKGRILVAEGQLEEAWSYFKQANEAAPGSPESIAMLDYGRHQAGTALRLAFPEGSPLNDKNYGENLTKGNATYSTSSSEGSTADRDSLFTGKYAKQGFAFHTKKEVRPHIIIDLQKTARVNALFIANRNRLTERAATLTVWISNDSITWTKVWAAEGAKTDWSIILETDEKAAPTGRYIKVGLDSDQPEHLHLQAVDAFGHFLDSNVTP